MKKDFLEIVAEERRLTILSILNDSTAQEANEYIVQNLLECFALRTSLDQLRLDFDWLKKRDLIAVDYCADVCIARLKSRGVDVLKRRLDVPGVKRPSV